MRGQTKELFFINRNILIFLHCSNHSPYLHVLSMQLKYDFTFCDNSLIKNHKFTDMEFVHQLVLRVIVFDWSVIHCINFKPAVIECFQIQFIFLFLNKIKFNVKQESFFVFLPHSCPQKEKVHISIISTSGEAECMYSIRI